MLNFLGPFYDGGGMLLEGDGPGTFGATQDVAMAFRVIIQAVSGDPDGELRLGDRLARLKTPSSCQPRRRPQAAAAPFR